MTELTQHENTVLNAASSTLFQHLKELNWIENIQRQIPPKLLGRVIVMPRAFIPFQYQEVPARLATAHLLVFVGQDRAWQGCPEPSIGGIPIYLKQFAELIAASLTLELSDQQREQGFPLLKSCLELSLVKMCSDIVNELKQTLAEEAVPFVRRD